MIRLILAAILLFSSACLAAEPNTKASALLFAMDMKAKGYKGSIGNLKCNPGEARMVCSMNAGKSVVIQTWGRIGEDKLGSIHVITDMKDTLTLMFAVATMVSTIDPNATADVRGEVMTEVVIPAANGEADAPTISRSGIEYGASLIPGTALMIRAVLAE